MDQAEMFKRLTEMLMSQQQPQLQSAGAYLSPQLLLQSSLPLFNSPSAVSSDAFPFPSNHLLQAAALFSSGLFNGSSNTINSSSNQPTSNHSKRNNQSSPLLQTPMANVNVAMLQHMLKTGEKSNSPSSRSSPGLGGNILVAPPPNPPNQSNNRSTAKRKLFESKEEGKFDKLSSANVKMMRQAATNISKEERIDLDELENFASMFKKQRIKFGFTQGDVGVALGKRYGTDFSQTTISRFEALNLSFKNMCKLRPLLKEWLQDAEAALANGASLNELLDRGTSAQNGGPTSSSALHNSTPSPSATSPDGNLDSLTGRLPFEPHIKRRRKRTNLDMNQRAALDAFFSVNPRPDHERMTEIANSLELDRDVVRVWFCNRRQKVRRHDDPEGLEVGGNNALFSFNDVPSSSSQFSSFPDSTSDDTMSENGQPSESAGPSTPLDAGTGISMPMNVTLEQLLKEAGVAGITPIITSTHNSTNLPDD
ncbi:hypothetical protein WR25_05574 isoform B [Diploscapter pachys]|nr:hypothetical protein WR25_05574 isoform B [Diploscapter pachys]